MSAHPCRIIYAVSEEDDAKKISEKLGYITTKSTGSSKTSGRSTSKSSSESEAQRALVLSRRSWERWIFKEEFIILKGENPVKAEKALYFLDPYFMDRLMMVSPKLTELTASLNKTKKYWVLKGLNILLKKKMLSVGELESEVLL